MGLFRFFRKKKASSKRSTRPHRAKDNGKRLSEFPELRDAWLKFETDFLDEARQAAEAHLDAADPRMATEALMLVALVSFRKGDYQAALPLLERIFSATGKTRDAFNLTTCHALLGNAERAEQAFEKTTTLYTSGDTEEAPPLPFIWYYFGCALRDGGHPERAIPMVEKLRPLYEELVITDDTFVYIRGVPFLSQTVSLGMDVLRATRGEDDARRWLKDFSKSLDDEGRAYLERCEAELDCDGGSSRATLTEGS